MKYKSIFVLDIHLGTKFLLHLNHFLQFFRRIPGIKRYWSLSKFIKENVKKSVNFITDYEKILVEYAKHKGYDGVICGHIHKAEIRQIDGIEYKNSGDWVESCTALVETLEGEWKIIYWDKHEKD